MSAPASFRPRVYGIDPSRLPAVRARLTAKHGGLQEWADRHGVPRHQVYNVLSGKRQCLRGDAHRIAIMLGLKDPLPGEDAGAAPDEPSA